MNILQTIRQGEFGGGETHLFELSTRLDSQKYTSIVLSFTDGNMVTQLRKCGIEVIVLHSKIPFDPRVIRKVIKLMKQYQIDLVHAHGTRAYSNVICAALLLGLPIVYTIHGWSFHDTQRPLVKWIRTTVESFLTHKSAVNICVSKSNRQTGIQRIKGFSCQVICNGVSFDSFDPNLKVHADRIIPKEKEDIIIGFIARMSVQKDPITLLKAFHILSKEYPHCKLLLIGSGELEEAVETFIEYHSMDAVIRLPFTTHVNEYLKQIDIFCLPSLWEGLPIGAIEAMAMKKVVVATSVDGTRELIVDGKNGYLFSPQDAEALIETLRKIMDNSARSNELSQNAYEFAREKFDVDTMVRSTERVYDEVIS